MSAAGFPGTAPATALGHAPVGSYTRTIGSTLDWTAAQPRSPSGADPHFEGVIDDAADGRFLEAAATP